MSDANYKYVRPLTDTKTHLVGAWQGTKVTLACDGSVVGTEHAFGALPEPSRWTQLCVECFPDGRPGFDAVVTVPVTGQDIQHGERRYDGLGIAVMNEHLRAWMDCDGVHVWIEHICQNGIVEHILPPPWFVGPDDAVQPSYSCQVCGIHGFAKVVRGVGDLMTYRNWEGFTTTYYTTRNGTVVVRMRPAVTDIPKETNQ